MKFIYFLFFFIISCTQTQYIEKDDIKSKTPLIEKVIYRVSDNFDANNIDCIAVLPFTSNGNEKNIFNDKELDIKDIARRSFYSHLSPYPFKDLEIEKINYLFQEYNLNNITIKETISDMFSCNFFIEGKITNLAKQDVTLYSNVTIGIEVKLIDFFNNQIIWEASEVKRSMGGDIPLSPLSILTGIYKSYKNTQDEKIFNLVDEINRHLINTLPKSKDFIFEEPSNTYTDEYELIADLNNASSIKEKEEILLKLSKVKPINKDHIFNLANFYFEHGNYDRSLSLLNNNNNYFMNDENYYFLKARNEIKKNNLDEAESNLIKTLKINNKNIIYFNALGYTYSLKENSEKALAAYQMALDINPDNGFANYNMAIEFYNLGQYENSIEKYYQAGNSYAKEGERGKLLMVINNLDLLENEGIFVKERQYQELLAKFNVNNQQN